MKLGILPRAGDLPRNDKGEPIILLRLEPTLPRKPREGVGAGVARASSWVCSSSGEATPGDLLVEAEARDLPRRDLELDAGRNGELSAS